MKYFLLFILPILCVILPATDLNAQKVLNDSIASVLKSEKEDTNKIIHVLSLADGLYVKDEYTATDSLDRLALALSQKLNFKKGSVKAYISLGNICTSQGNYADALKHLNQAMDIAKGTGYIKGIATIYGDIGNIYYYQGKYPDALKNYIESEKLYEKIKDNRGMGAQLGNIGLINYEQENYAEAIKNQLQGIIMDSLAGNVFGTGNAYGNIGNIYYSQAKYEDALHYYLHSLAISKQIGDVQGCAIMYEGIGLIYQHQGKYNDALKYYTEEIRISRQIGDKMGIANAYENLGRVLTKLKKYGEAKNDIDSALILAKKMANKETMANAYAGRMYIDTANSDYKAAFDDYRYYILYHDSLKNEENTKKIISEQMNYEFDKKQAAQQAEQDKKDAIAAADKKKQKIITTLVAIGLMLVMIFSGLLFSRFRITQRQKVIIEKQKAIVEEKNKEVTDSITYAKRLQDAILPPLSLVAKTLPESFVLYKPKDIVAGDFYWLERTESAILIAAADCTGHGVPGAMVSVVCSNALNRTVKEFKITEPGKILDKTRELVLETFEKSESNVQDGMDISLASLTPSEGGITLKWSGAFNSLWYIQNNELKELLADKQPIGKTDKPKPFTTHEIKLNPPSEGREAGVLLYLFTDGYADQFGGPKGKKFKYKALSEKLKMISDKPMAEQKQLLEQTFEEWKGNLEQVDDVLIIGIRV